MSEMDIETIQLNSTGQGGMAVLGQEWQMKRSHFL
jgi:hypothetical protein